MRSARNSKTPVRFVRLALMISSIALLLLFQSFWLATSYEQSYTSFERETSALLRSTVFSIRDSLFLSVLDNTPGGAFDSLQHDQVERRKHYNKVTIVRSDESPMNIHDNVVWTDSARITGTFRSQLDSVGHAQNFVIRIRSDDTLSTTMLHDRFRTVIDKADYSGPFLIRHLTSPARSIPPPDILPTEPDNDGKIFRRRSIIKDDRDKKQWGKIISDLSDTLVTEHIFIGPIHAYAAVFPDMRLNVIRRIAPQILFSIFLTAVTITAFVIMYSNLRSQERVMDMKNDFISNVTHELKTPIATVSVALEALKDFHALKNPTRTAEYLDIAQHELNRLSLMTDKILKASVFEQKGVEFVPGPVKLDEIVKQVASSLTIVLEKKLIKATIQLNGNDFQIQGSDMHVTNVVYNLLDNAIKYSPANTSVNIDLAALENEVLLRIRDNGIGIESIHHKKIFEKFFRVPSGDVHNSHGYGLGLSYVADVVRSHGGNITIESTLGQGTCFTVSLPRKA